MLGRLLVFGILYCPKDRTKNVVFDLLNNVKKV